MDTDEQLRQILITLRDGQKGSLKHEKDQLIRLLNQCPNVKKCWDTRIDYEAVMQEAYYGLLKNIKGFFLKIDLDNTPAAKVRVRLIQRFNRIVKNKAFDEYRKLKKQPLSLDHLRSQDDQEGDTFLDQLTDKGLIDKNSPTISLLDDLIKIEDQSQVWQYINTDPEGKLRGCHPKGRPDVNCQILAQRLLLKDPPDNLSKIARDLDINYQTVHSHWKRSCFPLVKEIATKFGYNKTEAEL